jgi:hypothetical protein
MGPRVLSFTLLGERLLHFQLNRNTPSAAQEPAPPEKRARAAGGEVRATRLYLSLGRGPGVTIAGRRAIRLGVITSEFFDPRVGPMGGFGWASAAAPATGASYRSIACTTTTRASSPKQRFFTSNNLAVSRDRLKALGGFDASFPLPAAEDRDLCDRGREQGGVRMSPAGFPRQQFQYGRGASYPIEARYFYAGLFTAPFRCMGVYPAARTAALLAVAQICNVLGFLRQRET